MTTPASASRQDSLRDSAFADVSVVMPAFRVADVIGRALCSIAAQTLKPKEVIVVVDGDEGTLEAARVMIPHMNGIDLRIFWQEHAGPGAARNRALRQSSCRWIAFLDADDEWLPGKLERSMAQIAQHDAILVAHDGVIVDGSETRENLCSRRFLAADDPFTGLYRRGFIDTCSVVVLRERVYDVGGFDPTLPVGQDFDLFLAILGVSDARFHVFAEPLVRYHIMPNSVTSNTFRRLFCQMRILRRHAPALRGRKGSRAVHVAFRTLAVHHEAIQTFRRRRHGARLLGVLALLPFHLMSGLSALLSPPAPRRSLSDPASAIPKIPSAARTAAPWWILTLGIYLAYAAQYLDFTRAVLTAMGFR